MDQTPGREAGSEKTATPAAGLLAPQGDLRALFPWIVSLINEDYCASSFPRIRTMAGLAASRYVPAAAWT